MAPVRVIRVITVGVLSQLANCRSNNDSRFTIVSTVYRNDLNTKEGKLPRYENPPLVQVWLAFEFDPSPDKKEWDLNLAEQFAKASGKDYPKIEALFSEELKVESSTDGTLPRIVDRRETIDLVRMTSEDGTRIRHLGDDRIAFNLLSKETGYLGFEPLLDSGVEYLDSYVSQFQPARVRSASIHHTDLIEIPVENGTLHIPDYFKSIPDVPTEPFGFTVGFSYSFGTKCPADDQVLAVRLNMIPPSTPDTLRIQVDWDKKCRGFEFADIENAKADLTASHEYMVECFEAFITDETRKLFGINS